MKGRTHQPGTFPIFGERPIWERKVVTIEFNGTYTDDAAESDGIARRQAEHSIQIEAAAAGPGLIGAVSEQGC